MSHRNKIGICADFRCFFLEASVLFRSVFRASPFIALQLRFQAASPDEVALVNFASEVGLRLVERDEHSMTLQVPYTLLLVLC